MTSKRASTIHEVGPVPKKQRPVVAKDVFWELQLESPGARLSALYNHSKLTDLTIIFPGFRDQLKVHRLVLAMSSPVFERMLFGPLAEKETLNLPEDPPEAFKLLIQYIYHGTADMKDDDTTIQVYHLANKYQMNLLRDICTQYILQNLNGTNLPAIYKMASLTEDELLLNECEMVMSCASELVLSSPNIGQLSHKNMECFLRQQLCIISEVSVFKGLFEWGRFQAGITSNKTPGPQRIRQKIKEFLPRVNFLDMTLDEFVEHVMPHSILTSKEVSSILMNIKNLGNIPLPSICRNQQENGRFFLDSENISRLCISYEQDEGNVTENSLTSDQLLISNLQVNGNIGLKSMYFSFPLGDVRVARGWVVRVTDSKGNVLGIVEQPLYDLESLRTGYVCYIGATFSTPIFLFVNRTYHVWLTSMSSFREHVEIYTNHENLTFSGQCYCYGETNLDFWCLDYDGNSDNSDSDSDSDDGEEQV